MLDAKVKIGDFFPLQLQPPCLLWTRSLLSVAMVPKPRASESGPRGTANTSILQFLGRNPKKPSINASFSLQTGNEGIFKGFKGKVEWPLIKLKLFKRLPSTLLYSTNRKGTHSSFASVTFHGDTSQCLPTYMHVPSGANQIVQTLTFTYSCQVNKLAPPILLGPILPGEV